MPRCKQCKIKFTPRYFNQKYCMDNIDCIKAFNESVKLLHLKQKEKAKIKEKKAKIEQLMTKSEWLKLAQQVFNKFIRLRDKHKGCISCDAPLINKFDAGHYYSVGAYPNLRFNEDNVHGQCVYCNQHRHGNIHEYTIKLPIRIGNEAFEQLTTNRGQALNISIYEVQELIKIYKQKVKILELETIN